MSCYSRWDTGVEDFLSETALGDGKIQNRLWQWVDIKEVKE